MFLGPAAASDESLLLTPLVEAISVKGVVYLTVAAAAVLLPALLDLLLEVVFLGIIPSSFEVVFLVLWSFAISLARIIFLDTPYAARFYGVSQFSLFWVYVCATFISLQRMCSGIFTPARVFLALSLTYSYSILEIWHFARNDGHSIITAIQIVKYVGFIYTMLLHLYFYAVLALEWYATKSSWNQWLLQLSADIRIALIISALFVFAVIFYFCAIIGFKKTLGVQNASTNFEYFFLSGSILTSGMITVIPQRLAKKRTNKMIAELETKKTFVRYISHELRTPLSILINGLDLVDDLLVEGRERRSFGLRS